MAEKRFDAFDLKILAVLQADGRIPNTELAERVGLSPTPCLRRVRALEAAGVIAGYRATLARKAVDLGLTVFVEVKVDGHRDVNAEAIQAAFHALPEVVACHLVSGEYDFLCQVVVPDLAGYEAFLRITSYNVCYTKLLRPPPRRRSPGLPAPSPAGKPACRRGRAAPPGRRRHRGRCCC